MADLNARFEIPLKILSLRFIAEGDVLPKHVSFPVGEFRTKITLESRGSTWLGDVNSTAKKFFFDHMTIELERSCVDSELELFASDFLGYVKLREDFLGALIEAINRVISYFKFELCGPGLNFVQGNDIFRNESVFYNPLWSCDGESLQHMHGELASQSGVILLEGVQFLGDYGFGVAKLSDEKSLYFEEFLQSKKEPDLFQQLLSDAQSAVLIGNYRRAVLELAVAAEIFIKSSFFARNSIAGAAIDYLESSGGKSLKAIELIGGAAKNAFGVSFKDAFKDDHQNIDYLFRARNSIAHRGETRFRDDKGDYVDVDRDLLKIWWVSVLNMRSWLTGKIKAYG